MNIIDKTTFDRATPTEVFKHLPLHKKVLHIGGHLGREAEYYNDVVFVEPIPKYAEYLRSKGFRVIEGAVCGDTLYVTSYDQASSILTPLEHKVSTTIHVKSYTLDEINDGTFDLLVMDVQGAELMILKSGELTFNNIIVEASIIPRYKGAPSKKEILDYLESNNYKIVKEFQHGNNDIYDIILERTI
jgi:FkbM family methyltransferase